MNMHGSRYRYLIFLCTFRAITGCTIIDNDGRLRNWNRVEIYVSFNLFEINYSVIQSIIVDSKIFQIDPLNDKL